jgi:hypothetical protein
MRKEINYKSASHRYHPFATVLIAANKTRNIVSCYFHARFRPEHGFSIILFNPLAAFIHYIMNADQLQQLLGVIRVGSRGGHKTAKFSSAKGTEWRIWRRNFKQTIQINGWANKWQQREAAAVMEGTDAKFTSNIPPYVAGRAIIDMLTLYKGRFLPAAAGQLAAAQFQTAAQMDGEQIAIWHASLRSIFERAFPGKDIQGSRLLINKFVLKLANSNIRQWTHRANPATYNAAMTAASNEAASQSILAHEAGMGGKVAINAFGGGQGACHGCGSFDHHIANCPLAHKSCWVQIYGGPPTLSAKKVDPSIPFWPA